MRGEHYETQIELSVIPGDGIRSGACRLSDQQERGRRFDFERASAARPVSGHSDRMQRLSHASEDV
jgi:hypothetical protein